MSRDEGADAAAIFRKLAPAPLPHHAIMQVREASQQGTWRKKGTEREKGGRRDSERARGRMEALGPGWRERGLDLSRRLLWPRNRKMSLRSSLSADAAARSDDAHALTAADVLFRERWTDFPPPPLPPPHSSFAFPSPSCRSATSRAYPVCGFFISLFSSVATHFVFSLPFSLPFSLRNLILWSRGSQPFFSAPPPHPWIPSINHLTCPLGFRYEHPHVSASSTHARTGKLATIS